MNISIYQIEGELDTKRIKFCSYDDMIKYSGSERVDPTIYKKVFSGNVDCRTLDDVYSLFNTSSPLEYRGHSLSVSDIIQVKNDENIKYYYCDCFGFKEVEFNSSLVIRDENLIRAVLLEVGKDARVVEIENSLRHLQRCVGGYIETYKPYKDNVCILCNENAKLMTNFLPNRAIYIDGQAKPVDVIYGNFILCAVDGENFTSLTEEQTKRYVKLLLKPGHFTRALTGGFIPVLRDLTDVIESCNEIKDDHNKNSDIKKNKSDRYGR